MPLQAQRGSTEIALPCLTSSGSRGWSSTPRVGRFTPGKEDRYPLLQEAGWLEPRTTEPIANYYTDNAVPDCQCLRITLNFTMVACFNNLPVHYSLSTHNLTLQSQLQTNIFHLSTCESVLKVTRSYTKAPPILRL